MNKIKPATQKKCLLAVELLLARLMLVSLPKLTGRTWDSLLQEHLEYLFDHGHNKTDASVVLAAVLWLEPGLGGSIREACSWSSAALRGWSRLEPGLTRVPLPYPVALAMVLSLAQKQLF